MGDVARVATAVVVAAPCVAQAATEAVRQNAAGTSARIGRSRLVLTTNAGAAGGSGELPPQELLYFGGPVSAPGYEFHELAARAGISQRVEWRTPVPFPSVKLGRFGRVPGQATLAPFE